MLKSSLALLLMVAFCSGKTYPRFATTRVLARQQAVGPPSPAPTGYPVAGITPEVPFNFPTSTAKPDITYLPPDNSYGPPPSTNAEEQPDPVYGPPDNTYLPTATEATATDEPEVEATVDEQPPPAPQPEVQQQPPNGIEEEENEDDEIIVAVADDGSVVAVSNAFDNKENAITGDVNVGEHRAARLVYQRFPHGGRGAPGSAPVPARLVKVRRTVPIKLQMLQLQPQSQIRLQPQPLPQNYVFTSRYTSW